MFSIPFNPKLTPDQFQTFLDFVYMYKNFIYDIYFTCRIPPFTQDAMGDVFKTEEFNTLIDNALLIQEATGVALSATFNNINVQPSEENLDLLIKHFTPLYDRGIRSMTIPHTHWALTGKLRKAFPDLILKNTILRNVHRPNEIIDLARAGFNYINLDRDLMRDHDQLRAIKEAKDHCRDTLDTVVKISLLANEGCWGNCMVQDEHFTYNLERSPSQEDYFTSSISKNTCPLWDSIDPAHAFKVANLPPWKKEWDYFLDELGIDVFKMHGRESVDRLFETMHIVANFASGTEVLWPTFDDYVEEGKILPEMLEIWNKKIRNCGFNCWKCNLCSVVLPARDLHPLADVCEKAYASAIVGNNELPEEVVAIKGLTSLKVKNFINSICNRHNTKYMELGVFQGAILCAAVSGNASTAIGIDHWEEWGITPTNIAEHSFPEDPKEICERNIDTAGATERVTLIKADMFAVDANDLPHKVNTLFYDGSHAEDSHHMVLKAFKPALEHEFIYIVDDWNWDQVRDGTQKGIEDHGFEILHKREIFTKGEDPNDFWNGLGIFVLKWK